MNLVRTPTSVASQAPDRAEAVVPPLPPGPTTRPPLIPDHELLRCIGRGAYGEVWLGRSVMSTWRAVKVVQRQTFERDEHFAREFKGIQRFEPVSRSHEGLVDILQIGRNDADGYFYYVMELAGFIPPEGPGTASADCYALGKVLYELSTGHGRTAWPEPPADLATRPDRKRLLELNVILHRACAPGLRQRYQSAEAMQAELALLQRGRSVKRRRAWEQRLAMGERIGLVSAVTTGLAVAGWWLFNDLAAGRRGMQGSQRVDLPPMVGTTNLEAWKLFERGNVCFRQFTIEGEKAARAHLTEAVRLDPNFVLAHNYLFAGYASSSALPYPEAQAGMRAMAKKLREVKPDSAEAYYAQAYVDFRLDLKFAEAERGFERAMQIDPSANARSFYGCYLVYMGRQEEARVQLRRMIDLDPAASVGESLLGCSYYAERNFARALFHFRRALELAPGYLFQHTMMGRTHEAMGDYLGALDHFQKMELGMSRPAEELRQKYDALRQAVNDSGAAGYWHARLERAQRRSNPEDQPYEMASILAQLGRKPEALDWLEKAYAKRDDMDLLLFDHYWDGLRNEPRFHALLKNVGFVR